MNKINKALKGSSSICFLDFEGTQFTGEMIALGAYFVSLNKNGTIKRNKNPIMVYVKCKNKIGKFVEELTGINQSHLDKYGVSFSIAMKELESYCGMKFPKTAFVTFGNNDIRILNQSISYNLDSSKEITSVIHKKYIDFQAIISEFIKDDSANPLSLSNYCELFEIGFDGTKHNPKDDAVNLARLYQAFLTRKDIVLDNYLKTLQKTRHLPDPIQKATIKLASGEDVSANDFVNLCKEYIS